MIGPVDVAFARAMHANSRAWIVYSVGKMGLNQLNACSVLISLRIS